MKKCPQCSAKNPPDAWLCACGYEFTGSEPTAASPAQPSLLRFDRLLFTIGTILMLVAAGLVYTLLQDRFEHLQFRDLVIALILAVCGFVSFRYRSPILIFIGQKWVAQLFRGFLIVLGLGLLGLAIIWAGCAMVAPRF